MRRPGLDVVGLVREVVGRILVQVACRDHECVLAAEVADVPRDLGDDLGAAGNGQRAPFDKVVLEIHDQQGVPHIGDLSSP